jgi:hypothetical protein
VAIKSHQENNKSFGSGPRWQENWGVSASTSRFRWFTSVARATGSGYADPLALWGNPQLCLMANRFGLRFYIVTRGWLGRWMLGGGNWGDCVNDWADWVGPNSLCVAVKRNAVQRSFIFTAGTLGDATLGGVVK